MSHARDGKDHGPMDAAQTPRRLLLVPEPARATPDDRTASGATPSDAPRPRVRRYRLARLGDGGASPPVRARRPR